MNEFIFGPEKLDDREVSDLFLKIQKQVSDVNIYECTYRGYDEDFYGLRELSSDIRKMKEINTNKNIFIVLLILLATYMSWTYVWKPTIKECSYPSSHCSV